MEAAPDQSQIFQNNPSLEPPIISQTLFDEDTETNLAGKEPTCYLSYPLYQTEYGQLTLQK